MSVIFSVLGDFVYYCILLLVIVVILVKTIKNFSNDKIDYDEDLRYDKETGFKDLDLAMLEQIKGGIETTDYVQNNNHMIEKYLNPVNSTFTSAAFINWAKEVIIQACNKSCNSPYVRNSLTLPDEFKNIKMAYLNLYKRKSGNFKNVYYG